MVPDEVEAIIEDHLSRYYLRRERPSLARVVREIRSACAEQGLQQPTRRTVQRRLDAIDAREVMKAREGAKAARQRFAPVKGQNAAERPLDVVQIDHTPADIILVDSFERKPIGRPWVTLAIDITSRMVTGYHVSFEAPSRLSVAFVLRMPWPPKQNCWLTLNALCLGLPRANREHPCRQWSRFPVPSLSVSLCGMGDQLVYRPPGSPHFGGHIERLIGTMMGAVHLLPGTTQSSVAAKGGYDAEANAAMTLREFDLWFALEICRYNNSIHSGLNCTPVAKWDALAREMSGDIPFDMEAFRVSFLPSEQRQVRRDGIHLFDMRYWSDALAGYVGRQAERWLSATILAISRPSGSNWMAADASRPDTEI